MAHNHHSYHQAGYGYSSSEPQQTFPVENTGPLDPTLYGGTPPMQLTTPSAWPGVYAPMPLISNEIFYPPPVIHTVQPPSSIGTENWASTSVLPPDFIPLSPSPPFVPATPSPPLQPVVHDRRPLSTNPPEYMWVPQRQYALTAHHFTAAPPILFRVDSGEPGIRLSAALNRKFSHLKDRDDLVFESSKSPTITMRLEWPGYASWGRQVRILDSRSVQQSISREKLAYEVAKTVFRFSQPEGGKRLSTDSGAPTMWTIGEDGIGLDDLILVQVENVSKGSWQPQFLVRRRR